MSISSNMKKSIFKLLFELFRLFVVVAGLYLVIVR
nr:MAG TPA: hypothetical protein [Caudoviricetes sp.]